jgi:lipoyl(octanoyl) transferase
MKKIHTVDLGVMRYADALRVQSETFEKVRREEMLDTLYTVEHPHVYTFTKEANKSEILFSEAERAEKGIDLFEIRRGGDVTYHGFGQLVAYPILNMNHFYLDAHRYLRDLEEVVIQTLTAFGVHASRKAHPDPKKNYTGVWVGDEKICAIGVRFAHWTTMHGLALNVNTDLSYFNGIVPCGIKEKGVTSLSKVLNQPIRISDVQEKFLQAFARQFGAEIMTV